MTQLTPKIVDLHPREAERIRGVVANLEALLARLETVLLEENVVLESNVSSDHEVFITRKNQVLREMMLLQRSAADPRVMGELSERLKAVRALVDRNHALLKLQVDAMQEVSSIMKEATLSEESDGTYSRTSR